jgi:dTDP-4-dehydrorhamnose reductase
MKILITGAKGQLGLTLQDVLKKHELVLTDREELDITDSQTVDNYISKSKPDIIINTAAYTAVDKAEEEKELAESINALGPKILAEAAKKNKAIFFHISTDFVFDGKSKTPYIEDDEPKPVSIYGQTKYDGDLAIKEIGGKYYILRPAWLYSPFGKNFVKTMIKLGQERDELKVVADQIGCPTYTYDLANAIKFIIDHNFSADFGLYHFTGDGSCSWFEFATEIIKLSEGCAKVLKITTKEYGAPAARPAYSVLNCTKIKALGVKTYPWQKSLRKCLEILKSEN